MRWLFLFLILIGCSDNEDMRLFQTSLSKAGGSIPLPIDGGVSTYLTPDASGGDVGYGFTCTGLYFHKWNNGNPQFWVGNDGRNREPAAGGSNDYKPSIVLIELAYDNTDNGLPVTTYATKVKEYLTEDILDGSNQGVIEANDGTLWYACFGAIINIENNEISGVHQGIEISRFTVANANGLAYDDINNELLVKSNGDGIIRRYSMSGIFIEDTITVNANIDQIGYRSSDDLFYGGTGSNGSSGNCLYYNLSDGTYYGDDGYLNVQASEGVSLVYNQQDGKEYLYYASDGWFHQTPITDPNLQINAIFKRIKTVITP